MAPAARANGELQLCDPTAGSGIIVNAHPSPNTTLNCSALGEAFSLNNAASTGMASGLPLSSARVTGYDDGTLELKGENGIHMLNSIYMNGNQITQVGAGVLSSTSLDAVNGSQLYATNLQVQSNSTAITTLGTTVAQNTANLNTLTTNLNNGTVGLVRQDAVTGAISVAASTGGNVIDMSGTDGTRTVTGVANGVVSATSTDAVNGSQLYALSQQVGQMNAANAYVSVDGAGDGSDNAAAGTGTMGTAVGANATVTASNGVAIGANASATAANGVALGAGSVADRANSVSVGAQGAERQVTNVAAGTHNTDAVNVGQLNPVVGGLGGGAHIDTATGAVTGPAYQLDGQTYYNVGDALGSLDTGVQRNREGLARLDNRIDQANRAIDDVARNAYSGIAATTALTMIPEVDPGKRFALGLGAATYRGYQAVAVGASARVNDRVKLKAGVGMASGGPTAGIGASMQW
nr:MULTISPECIES: YadA-like family protein [Achromobacter]